MCLISQQKDPKLNWYRANLLKVNQRVLHLSTRRNRGTRKHESCSLTNWTKWEKNANRRFCSPRAASDSTAKPRARLGVFFGFPGGIGGFEVKDLLAAEATDRFGTAPPPVEMGELEAHRQFGVWRRERRPDDTARWADLPIPEPAPVHPRRRGRRDQAARDCPHQNRSP